MSIIADIDKILRIIAGLILLSLVFMGPHPAWGWIGMVPLATGLSNWRPLYSLPGFTNCPIKQGI